MSYQDRIEEKRQYEKVTRWFNAYWKLTQLRKTIMLSNLPIDDKMTKTARITRKIKMVRSKIEDEMFLFPLQSL
jgi:hypothetical protein